MAKKKAKASIFSMFLDVCGDIWIKVLFAALIMKVLMIFVGWLTGNDIYEVISIIGAIVLSTGYSTLTEYKNTSRACVAGGNNIKCMQKSCVAVN